MQRSSTSPTYTVTAEWDGEARVWVATSDDVPGLATEADTFEALAEKLRAMVPELLAANGVCLADAARQAHFRMVAERDEQARVVA